jgi:hypothetical protein
LVAEPTQAAATPPYSRTTMRYLSIALCSLALALPRAAQSQVAASQSDSAPTTHPLERGNHVRLTLAGDTSLLIGHIVGLDQNQIMVAPDDSGPPRTIALGQVARVGVERDARLQTVSATIGMAVGGVAAAAYYYFGWCRADENGCARDQRIANAYARYDQTYFTTGSVFAIGGMLAGGLLGYFIAPAPHWEIIVNPVASPGLEQGAPGTGHAALNIGVAKRLFGR